MKPVSDTSESFPRSSLDRPLLMMNFFDFCLIFPSRNDPFEPRTGNSAPHSIFRGKGKYSHSPTAHPG